MQLNSLLESYGLKCTVGAKTRGYISVEGTPVNMPVTVIVGAHPGKELLITGGVHGGEYPGIETAIRLANQLTPEAVSGTILIIHPVNTPAFFARMQYFGPYDGKNLNRVFPGKAKGPVSERIAYTINQLQQCADFYIDLHGGDIHESLVPFVIYSTAGGTELAEKSRKVAALMGFPYVVGSPSENGSIGGATTAGIPGFLAELGQCGQWSEAEVERYIESVMNVLRYFQSIAGKAKETDVRFLKKMVVTTTVHDGCWYPSRQLEDQVNKGEKMGEVRDLFGEVLSEYFAEEDGPILYQVTSLAVTNGDPLLAIGVED